ncbi:expressed unknown protein [Seminavis robusta]|uniref:C2H2-type domain-containing protein n=1 Tax=Seminavis robusta TaxID=568900 RepID=A0A9N8E3L6_9STRA|nr:expressed unknown protein [Seminavis robusta]|eukprot:Sro519_g159010.1 n/a (234) ;mRNA; f:36057-36758
MQQAVTLPLVGNLECTGHGCNATFHFENDLFLHMKCCKSQEFDCPYCDDSGLEPENFLGEHLNARGAKSRQCKKKPGNFRLTKDQREHDATLDFMTPHKCQFCKLRFATKKNLAQHEKEKHGKGKKKSIVGKKTVKQPAAKKTTISKNSAPKKPATKKSIPVKRTASQSTTEAPPLLGTTGGSLAGATAERTVLGELSGVENGIGVQRSNRRSKRLKKSTDNDENARSTLYPV